jgi:hypothetical protein
VLLSSSSVPAYLISTISMAVSLRVLPAGPDFNCVPACHQLVQLHETLVGGRRGCITKDGVGGVSGDYQA